MENALSVENLIKDYGSFQAVRGISFNVKPGEIFALIGPNGAGKSTTLKMITTILSPTGGSIKVFGKDITKNADMVRKMISYLPEEAGAYKRLSGLDYLKLMAGLYADSQEEANNFFINGKKITDLGEKLKDRINTYSKGMTRKLLLARTIMVNPKLAILDEPTSGLDVINAMEIRNKIKESSEKGMAVLLSSHNMLEIEYLSDRVAIIDKGVIYETGTPKELKDKYKAKNLEDVFVKVAT